MAEQEKKQVSGRIKVIMNHQQISPTFRKREMVVVTPEQYPQSILIEFTQDKADLLGSFFPGDEVLVSINIRGREWVNPMGETRYFNSIQGWRIEKIADGYRVPTEDGGYMQHNMKFPPAHEVFDDVPKPNNYERQPAPRQTFTQKSYDLNDDDDDDLPF